MVYPFTEEKLDLRLVKKIDGFQCGRDLSTSWPLVLIMIPDHFSTIKVIEY